MARGLADFASSSSERASAPTTFRSGSTRDMSGVDKIFRVFVSSTFLRANTCSVIHYNKWIQSQLFKRKAAVTDRTLLLLE